LIPSNGDLAGNGTDRNVIYGVAGHHIELIIVVVTTAGAIEVVEHAIGNSEVTPVMYVLRTASIVSGHSPYLCSWRECITCGVEINLPDGGLSSSCVGCVRVSFNAE